MRPVGTGPTKTATAERKIALARRVGARAAAVVARRRSAGSAARGAEPAGAAVAHLLELGTLLVVQDLREVVVHVLLEGIQSLLLVVGEPQALTEHGREDLA